MNQSLVTRTSVVILALWVSCAHVSAQTFIPASSMAAARNSHEVTLLATGEVLVTGGESSGSPSLLPTAELYNPTTNEFLTVGEMITGRAAHRATLLLDGRVLITGGGVSTSQWTDTAEIYDPTMRAFAPLPSMHQFRNGHTSTRLVDGTVLITGGFYFDRSGELFDPLTNSFVLVGEMATSRARHSATLLPDGRVLIVGGYDHQGASAAVNTAELYDPSTRSFSSTGAMQFARELHTATLLPSGRVLVAGGGSDTAELYDPATGTFSLAGTFAAARTLHTASLLPDGRVLISGGFRQVCGDEYGGDGCLRSYPNAEVYDPRTGLFAFTSTAGGNRADHRAVGLPDGNVLLTGGWTADRLNTAEIFVPPPVLFRPVGAMANERNSHEATLLTTGEVLITGGESSQGSNALAELYNPATNEFTPIGEMNTSRAAHRATLLRDGRVLITGGGTPDSQWTDTAEIFDPATRAFSAIGPMHQYRNGHSSTRLANGTVLIAGGFYFDSSAEIFDPISNSFVLVGAMGVSRTRHTATLLSDGKVLLLGGYDHEGTSGPVNSAELYDPNTRTFAPAAPMHFARELHTATLLPDGSVLVVGGSPDSPAEVYDPATDSFTLTGRLTADRRLHTASLLADGRVLIAGGTNDICGVDQLGRYRCSRSYPDAEIYDPTSGLFSSVPSPGAYRADHRAVVLSSGNVLLTGGWTVDRLATAELFVPLSTSLTVTGSDVSVQPVDGGLGAAPATLTFASVTAPGVTTITSTNDSPAPPAGFTVGEPAMHYDLSTTAVFDGPIEVCISYAGVTFAPGAQPALLHYEGGQWRDVTTSVDLVGHTVCGQVMSLSPFAVLGKPSIAQLQTDVAALEITKLQQAVLLATLRAASRAIADGDRITATLHLRMFKAELERLHRKGFLSASIVSELSAKTDVVIRGLWQ